MSELDYMEVDNEFIVKKKNNNEKSFIMYPLTGEPVKKNHKTKGVLNPEIMKFAEKNPELKTMIENYLNINYRVQTSFGCAYNINYEKIYFNGDQSTENTRNSFFDYRVKKALEDIQFLVQSRISSKGTKKVTNKSGLYTLVDWKTYWKLIDYLTKEVTPNIFTSEESRTYQKFGDRYVKVTKWICSWNGKKEDIRLPKLINDYWWLLGGKNEKERFNTYSFTLNYYPILRNGEYESVSKLFINFDYQKLNFNGVSWDNF